MARKGRAVNRRKPSPGGGRPGVALLVVAALIALAFFALEHFRKSAPPEKPVAGAEQAQRLPLPQRAVTQQKLSSASLPAPKPQVARPLPKGPGQVAIIIDDMGSSMKELQAFLSIKLPITFSVIPSLAHAKDVSEAAHQSGAEVMVHMPMGNIKVISHSSLCKCSCTNQY